MSAQVEVRGSVDFCRDVNLALQALSTTRQYQEHFLNVVKCVQQSKRLKFFASAVLSRKGCKILLRTTYQVPSMSVVMILAHEAYHNYIYHEYLHHYGRFRAGRIYYRDFFAIERRCVSHEISIAKELNFPPEEVDVWEFYLRLIQHPKSLPEQVKIIRRLRSLLHES